MAFPTTDVPQGMSLTFGTSAFAAQLMGANSDGISRSIRDVTNLATTGSRQKKPGKLKDEGSVSMRIQFNPDSHPPISAVAETLTITFPTPVGSGHGASIVGSGFISEWNWDGQGGDEEEMTAEMTWTWDGNVIPTLSVSGVSGA